MTDFGWRVTQLLELLTVPRVATTYPFVLPFVWDQLEDFYSDGTYSGVIHSQISSSWMSVGLTGLDVVLTLADFVTFCRAPGT